ncbi:putative membrane protein YvbJ [Pullulanibacillus pueri]|nr:putative membrane protein YvbJ [Pullulanibacillus pueri]
MKSDKVALRREETSAKEQVASTEHPSPPQDTPASQKRLSRKAWIGMGSGVMVIILLVTAYLVMANHYGRSHAAKTLSEAIKTENASKIADLLIYTSGDTNITQASVKPFTDYLKEHPNEKKNILKDIETQGQGHGVYSSLFDLKIYKHKKWGLFKVYTFAVDPYRLTINPVRAEANVTVNGQTKTYDGKQALTFDHLFPGQYQIEGSWSGDYAKLHDEQTVELTSPKDLEQSVDLDLKGQLIELHTNAPHAKVLINSQETDLQAADIQHFGPVDPETTFALQSEKLPWGTVTSEPIQVTKDQTDYTIQLTPFDKDTINTMLETMNTFAKQRAKANSQKRVEAYQNVDKSYLVDLETEIKYMGATKGWKNAKLMKTEYAIDNLDYETNYKKEYVVQIPAKFTYHVDTNKKTIEQQLLVSVAYVPKDKNWKLSYSFDHDFPKDAKQTKAFNF